MSHWTMKQSIVVPTRFVAPKLVSSLAVLIVVVVSGCQPLMNKKSMIPWGKKEKEQKVLPDRILTVWTDTVLHQPGQTGVRGFGGRVYFYEKDKTDPIEVEGSLAVYAFDAEDEAIDSQKPLRKFVFTPEHLAGKMSKTSIGPSYSIWLPWSAVGDPPQKLSLITRFEGIEGGTTISDPVIKLLPGIAKKPTAEKKSMEASHESSSNKIGTDHGVQQASFLETQSPKILDQNNGRSVETIELPPGFQRHLKNSNGSKPGMEQEFEPEQILGRGVTTQVFDSKNPLPSAIPPIDQRDSGDNESGAESRFFSSPRPNRDNIRSGAWLKPERRLQDGLERKQQRERASHRDDTAL